MTRLIYPHKSKYRSQKVLFDGILFDSKKELNRYKELRLLEDAGIIKNLKRQVRYTLIPGQKDKTGKSIERPCTYLADFVYEDCNGSAVVEDTKGMRTPEYVIKRKLMLFVHGIRIVEI